MRKMAMLLVLVVMATLLGLSQPSGALPLVENVTAASTFRDDFGQQYGVTMTDGPLRGLLARSVVVLDADGSVLHSQLVPEIGTEPDYDAAVAALG